MAYATTDVYLCDADFECQSSVIVCALESECTVTCSGDDACRYASINAYYANSLDLYTGSTTYTDYLGDAVVYLPNNVYNNYGETAISSEASIT